MLVSLRGKSKSTNRLWATLSVALAVYLASWLGLLPLVQVVHLGLADHDHRYCEQHNQVEDFPHSAAAGHLAPASADGATTNAALSTIDDSSTPLRHVACSFLNHATARDPLLLSDQPAPTNHPEQLPALASSLQPEFISSPLLLSAPKTSPPSSAA